MRYQFICVLLCLGVSAYEDYGKYQEDGDYAEKVCKIDVSSNEVNNEYCEHGCCGDYTHRDRRCCDSGENQNTEKNVNASVGEYQEDEDYAENVCKIDVSSNEVDNKYCEHGCCGDYTHRDRRCCDSGRNQNTEKSVNVSLGVYLGGGFGGLGVFIVLIVVCCCCVKKICK
ncbi:uncharacterized protein LOC128552235 [Mercenaria mercenaria]|uniref:uncharacterized protein LOC128552235 n=1 Tax=Mercenaria mercenaria TaxID=6596 RepID=UPI00234E3D45|nr:uncharacterized protein LOC128552235 [Mercenaria mercenaria]